MKQRLLYVSLLVRDYDEAIAYFTKTLGFSLRGLAYFELHVRGANSDLHSGEFGGAVTNPANALARIIASLHDEHGRIAIDGFYDDVLEWDAETREQIESLDDLRGFLGLRPVDELLEFVARFAAGDPRVAEPERVFA